MSRERYKPLPMTRLQPGVSYQPPGASTPGLVREDSPAFEVMTDLRQVAAATIGADATVDQANQAMIARGVRMLLVVNAGNRIEGLITARDTLGEKPVMLARERGIKRNELSVAELMVRSDAIEVLDIATVMRAEVGHIIATLKERGRQHAMVVDTDQLSGQQVVRGIFSASQIGRQLGIPILSFEIARTFADIEASLTR